MCTLPFYAQLRAAENRFKESEARAQELEKQVCYNFMILVVFLLV